MDSWSASRDGALNSCERQYFYRYLTRARLNSQDRSLQEIAYLKDVKTIPIWQGEVFHDSAAGVLRALQAGQPVDYDQVIRDARDRMMSEWDYSSRNTPGPSSGGGARSGTILFEHEYAENPPQALRDGAVEFVVSALMRYMNWVDENRMGERIGAAARAWIEPPLFGSGAAGFVLDGTRVFTKVDLALQDREGAFHIFDWKTGPPPTNYLNRIAQSEFQVAIYQLWPCISMDAPLGLVQAHIVHVGSSPVQVISYKLDEESRDATLSSIRRSIARMHQFAEAWESSGMQVTDLEFASSPGLCRRCSFKRLCRQSIDTEGVDGF